MQGCRVVGSETIQGTFNWQQGINRCHRITIAGVMASPSRWHFRLLSDKNKTLHTDDPKVPWNDKNFGCTMEITGNLGFR